MIKLYWKNINKYLIKPIYKRKISAFQAIWFHIELIKWSISIINSCILMILAYRRCDGTITLNFISWRNYFDTNKVYTVYCLWIFLLFSMWNQTQKGLFIWLFCSVAMRVRQKRSDVNGFMHGYDYVHLIMLWFFQLKSSYSTNELSHSLK